MYFLKFNLHFLIRLRYLIKNEKKNNNPFLIYISPFLAVARGFISSLFQNEAIQQTDLTIHSSDIMRDSEPKVFDHKIINENSTYYVGTISRPLRCGTKVGSGEFLFIGRWRLGIPILSCAPRFTEWEKIKQEAIESDNLDCLLQ